MVLACFPEGKQILKQTALSVVQSNAHGAVIYLSAEPTFESEDGLPPTGCLALFSGTDVGAGRKEAVAKTGDSALPWRCVPSIRTRRPALQGLMAFDSLSQPVLPLTALERLL